MAVKVCVRCVLFCDKNVLDWLKIVFQIALFACVAIACASPFGGGGGDGGQ